MRRATANRTTHRPPEPVRTLPGMETAADIRESDEFRMAILVMDARAMAHDGRARQLRQAARLTQAEVAKVCGAKPETVNRWEAGDRTPSGEPARRYAVLLADLAARRLGTVEAAQEPDPAHGRNAAGLAFAALPPADRGAGNADGATDLGLTEPGPDPDRAAAAAGGREAGVGQVNDVIRSHAVMVTDPDRYGEYAEHCPGGCRHQHVA